MATRAVTGGSFWLRFLRDQHYEITSLAFLGIDSRMRSSSDRVITGRDRSVYLGHPEPDHHCRHLEPRATTAQFAALNAAPANSVVKLNAGSYNISQLLILAM
jgi:hypothetical protein